LEDLILHPKIWKGTGRGLGVEAVPTGFIELDKYLPGGGWPQNAITEVFVEHYGIGELSLLMPACMRRQSIVWIAPPYLPYAPALVRHGIKLERVLLIRSSGSRRDTLWATEQVLRSRRGLSVLAWFDCLRHNELRRLQLTAEEQNAWVVFFRPMSALTQRSPAALRIVLSRWRTNGTGDLQLQILKCRGGRPGVLRLDLSGVPRPEKMFGDGGVG